VEEVASGLPSSYHRDFQLLKRPTLAGLGSTRELLEVLTRLVPVLQIRAEAAARACDDTLYAAHHAFVLVGRGMPFRDAYRQVALQIADGTFQPDRTALTATHLGGAGNLALEQLRAELAAARSWITDTHRALAASAERVWQL
jgi:argininosuccinate lyase